MNFLGRSLLAVGLIMGLLLGSNLVSNVAVHGTAHAFPDDIQLPPEPPPPPEDDCWEEGPNGYLVNTCYAIAPVISPEPTPEGSPEPSATPEGEEEDMDDEDGFDEDLDEGDPFFDEDGAFDLDQQAGGCSLSALGGPTSSNLFYMFGMLMAGWVAWRWKRML